MIGAVVAIDHDDHYGTGFADYQNPTGDSVTFHLNQCKAGERPQLDRALNLSPYVLHVIPLSQGDTYWSLRTRWLRINPLALSAFRSTVASEAVAPTTSVGRALGPSSLFTSQLRDRSDRW